MVAREGWLVRAVLSPPRSDPPSQRHEPGLGGHSRHVTPAALAVGAVVVALVSYPVFSVLHEATRITGPEDEGLVTGPPWLLAILLPLAGAASSLVVQRLLGGPRIDERPLRRLIIAFAGITAFCWAAGWSVMVPVYAVPIAVLHVHRSGSRVWRPAAALTVVLTVLGQTGVQLDLVDSVLDEAGSHVAALWVLVAAVLAIMGVGMAAAGRESATAAVARTEARLRALMESSSDVLTVSDADGILTYVSPAALRSMGYDPQELIGNRRLLDLVDQDFRPGVAERLEQVVAAGRGARARLDVLVVLATQERRWYEWTVHNLLDEPLVAGMVVDQRDVTERLLHQEELAHAAAHDDLTGLANRGELMRRLEAVLPQAALGAGVAVVFIDLDRFKEVNDTYGHATGDALLVVVAQRLSACLRAHDHLARLGGDEFCAILTEIRGPEEVQVVVERLEKAVRQPVALGHNLVEVGASIGTALTMDAGRNPDELFSAADAQMYGVKHRHHDADRRRGSAG